MRFSVRGRPAFAYTGGRPLGDGRETLVFIHGAQHDHSVWILQSRYFAHHGFNVLALDLPGHGRSAGPALDTVEALADWVLASLDAAGVRSALLVGHSMGSLIALEAAAQAPLRIAGAALLGAAAPMRVSDALLQAARDDEPRAFDMINAWSHSTLSALPGCPGPGFSVFMQNRRLMERQAPGTLFIDFNACNAYSRAFESVAKLRCPSLFISGARDLMTPPKSVRPLIESVRQHNQHASLPEPLIVEIADCGHAMMSERPDTVLTALRSFVQRIDDSSGRTEARQ